MKLHKFESFENRGTPSFYGLGHILLIWNLDGPKKGKKAVHDDFFMFSIGRFEL